MKKIKKEIYYEVNPRFFYDSNNDGIGDLQGLSRKIDYFSYLNIDCIILQDVVSVTKKNKQKNFIKIAPEIGTENDFIKFVTLCQRRKIKVFIDLSIGSINKEHEWFINTENDKSREFTNLISFQKDSPKKSKKNEEYQYSPKKQLYYAVNSKTKEIPLNWENEKVFDLFLKVFHYWIDLGVSGFVFKDFEYMSPNNKKDFLEEGTLKILRSFYQNIFKINDKLLIIGKSKYISLLEGKKYIASDVRIFDKFISTQISHLGEDLKYGIDLIGDFSIKKLTSLLSRNILNNPGLILSFGSCETGRINSRWGEEGQFSQESSKLLNLLLLFNKSSNLIYYGDEIGALNIGLTYLDDFQDYNLELRRHIAIKNKIKDKIFMKAQVLQNPINSRSLMAWDESRNGGFSSSEKTIIPVSTTYKDINVKQQYSNKNSTFLFVKKIINLLKNNFYQEFLEDCKVNLTSSLNGVIKIIFKKINFKLIVLVNFSERVKKIFKIKQENIFFTTSFLQKNNKFISKLEPYEGIIYIKENVSELTQKTTIKYKDFSNAEDAIFIKENEVDSKISNLEDKTKEDIKNEINTKKQNQPKKVYSNDTDVNPFLSTSKLETNNSDKINQKPKKDLKKVVTKEKDLNFDQNQPKEETISDDSIKNEQQSNNLGKEKNLDSQQNDQENQVAEEVINNDLANKQKLNKNDDSTKELNNNQPKKDQTEK